MCTYLCRKPWRFPLACFCEVVDFDSRLPLSTATSFFWPGFFRLRSQVSSPRVLLHMGCSAGKPRHLGAHSTRPPKILYLYILSSKQGRGRSKNNAPGKRLGTSQHVAVFGGASATNIQPKETQGSDFRQGPLADFEFGVSLLKQKHHKKAWGEKRM